MPWMLKLTLIVAEVRKGKVTRPFDRYDWRSGFVPIERRRLMSLTRTHFNGIWAMGDRLSLLDLETYQNKL